MTDTVLPSFALILALIGVFLEPGVDVLELKSMALGLFEGLVDQLGVWWVGRWRIGRVIFFAVSRAGSW